MTYAIELREIRKSFGPVRAVDGLSLAVPRGAVYGFLGPNGAGKTTTLRMIMDIIRPDSGEIRLFSEPSSRSVRSRVGYMPEERGLYRKMTAVAVLRYFGSLKGMTAAQLSQCVPAWLERIDLTGYANKKVEELSRGMHQKLQFAATVINDPELVILDEPFSGLDPVNQDLLREIITTMRSQGRTVLFSTHGMHEAEQLCDFIVLINQGKVVVDGTLDQIRSRHESDTISIEIEGDGAFVGTLPQVAAVRPDGRRLDVTLHDGADPQELLRILVERSRVRAFEVKHPSLHEIFVRLVGGGHVEDR
ncbi:MAG TPA: ATP-binding cassette domain-containing protein [Sedimentisphaerales bacterium]|nr:ATP-binding cassette domain-containing protein [Sedimentisphaerales bacterium]